MTTIITVGHSKSIRGGLQEVATASARGSSTVESVEVRLKATRVDELQVSGGL